MILNNYTKKQFKEMQIKIPDGKFTDIIVVPTDKIHDSGFRCMKFVLYNGRSDEIVGVVGGYSDVVHFNGVGGYGKSFNFHKLEKPIGYKIDCLRKSGYLRIMTAHYLEISDFIGSDFDFYVGKSIYERDE